MTNSHPAVFLPQKPSTLGDLVGVAFRIFREKWRYFVAKLFWPSLFASLSITAIEWVWVFFLKGGGNIQNFAVHLGTLFGFGLVFILTQWELVLRCVALLRTVFEVDDNFETAYTYARKHQWRIMVVYTAGVLLPALVILFTMVGTVLLLTFGKGMIQVVAVTSCFAIIAGGTVLEAMSLILTAIWFVLVSLEDIGIVKIMGRGIELVSPFWWRSGSFMTLLCFSAVAVCLTFYLPLIIVAFLDNFACCEAPKDVLPLHTAMLETAVGTILSILSSGVLLVGSALYYRDLQFRLEGMDISNNCHKLLAGTQETKT